MASTPTPPPPTGTVGQQVCAQLEAVRELLRGVNERLPQVFGDELHEVAAALSGVVAQAEAARAAVVLEAQERGALGSSDFPKTRAWVEQSCREAGVPINGPQAAQLHAVTKTCSEHKTRGIKQAVIDGNLPMNTAATVARIFANWRNQIEFTDWDALEAILVKNAADGMGPKQLHALEESVIGLYGKDGLLEDEHARAYLRRSFSDFRKDAAGMWTAHLRLDSASQAQFTAALNALSAPALDENGVPDGRTAGQRRADALITMATMAAAADPHVPNAGVKAQITVTVPLADLQSGLARHAQHRRDQQNGHEGPPPQSGQSWQSGQSGQGTGQGIHDEQRTSGPAFGPTTESDRGCGLTGFDQVLSATEARVLACDAGIIPAVMGSEREPLDLGRKVRRITAGQRAALYARDKKCTYPGCTAPPAWCDGHHIQYWRFEGRTDMNNLALLCRHHHTEIHRRGHVATVDDHGGVHWTRNDGTPIGNQPRPGEYVDHTQEPLTP